MLNSRAPKPLPLTYDPIAHKRWVRRKGPLMGQTLKITARPLHTWLFRMHYHKRFGMEVRQLWLEGSYDDPSYIEDR